MPDTLISILGQGCKGMEYIRDLCMPDGSIVLDGIYSFKNYSLQEILSDLNAERGCTLSSGVGM